MYGGSTAGIGGDFGDDSNIDDKHNGDDAGDDVENMVPSTSPHDHN